MKKIYFAFAALLFGTSICSISKKTYAMEYKEKETNLLDFKMSDYSPVSILDKVYTPTTKTNLDVDKTMKVTPSFNHGIMGQHYDYIIQSCNRVQGVYSVITPIIGKELLSSGAMTYTSDVTMDSVYSYNKTAFYSTNFETDMESSLAASLGYADGVFTGTGSVETKTSCNSTAAFECSYVHAYKDSVSQHIQYTLNTNCLEYVPDNSNIAIGLVGTYYLYEISYRKWNETWFGHRLDHDWRTAKIVVANESSFAQKFVCTVGADSETWYYYNNR